MLNVMRDNLKHLKWVLLIVAISMTAYLIPGFLRDLGRGGAGGDWAARVNDTEIPAQTFINSTRSQDNYYRNLLGDQYDQLKEQLRLGSNVIRQLIYEQIQVNEARKLGFQASDREIADMIMNDPSLKDPQTGKFIGKERYLSLAKRGFPGGAEALEQAYAAQIMTRKWVELVTQAVKVYPEEVEAEWRARNVKTRIRYAVVPSSRQKTDTRLTDKDYQAWYDAHQEDYRQGVSRTFRYAVVERKSVLDDINVTDEQIEAYYNSNPDNFRNEEQRRASHILLAVAPNATPEEKSKIQVRAQNILDRIRAGESIADLAPQLSDDKASASKGGDLGFFGKGRMVPSFEEAVFRTPVGQVADLVETQFGYHIIQVTGRKEAGVAPLADVKEDIRRNLSLQDAEDRVRAKAEQLRAGADSPEQFAAAAEAAGLELKEFQATADDPLSDLAPSPEFRQAMFELPIGGVSQPVRTAKGMAILAVLDEQPPGIAPLEQVKEKVGSAILNDRLRKASLAAAEKAFSRGKSVDQAAKTLGLEVQDSGDLTPGPVVLPGAGGDTPKLQAALFGDQVATGAKGVLPVPAGALIYEVTDRAPFDPVAFEAGKSDLESELLKQKREVYLQTVLNELWKEYEITVNQELVSRYDS